MIDADNERPYRAHSRGGSAQRPLRRTERMTADEPEEDSGWRRERSTARSRADRTRPIQTATLKLPVSGQEFQRWLQAGGWRYLAGLIGVILLLFISGMVFNRSSSESTAGNRPGSAATLPAGVVGTVSPMLALVETATANALQPTPTVRAFVVAGTAGAGLFLRPAPSRNGEPLATIPDGTRVEQAGADVTDSSDATLVWRQIRTADGQTGYVAAQFLTPLP